MASQHSSQTGEAGGAQTSEVMTLKPRDDVFRDAAIRSVESRALAYLSAGAAVHFRGPAGAGKTTLAHELAARMGRPAVLVTGDGWFTAENLVGAQAGERTKKVHDRFIHNVTKTESATTALWEDRALTIAMEQGYTLVYDEFTRSPPEANNPLLSALEEGVLVLATHARARRVIKAHPDFRAIFTSNTSDYAAVKTPQDALLDRMITFDLGWHDAATEIGIVARRSGLEPELTRPIVELVRHLRADAGLKNPPSMRTAIMIARIVEAQRLSPSAQDDRFVQLCFDALESRAPDPDRGAEDRRDYFDALRAGIIRFCRDGADETAAESASIGHAASTAMPGDLSPREPQSTPIHSSEVAA